MSKEDYQLEATLIVCGEDFPTGSLSKEERDLVIKKMIEQYDGIQAPGLGTVVFSVPLDGLPEGMSVQLWIHDWE